ncbi:MAG: hypothetical protein HY268_33555 [Deltaproteobacteria bacterium]|nr:hypothetical protein [Deltaproteobacteria bacterium]
MRSLTTGWSAPAGRCVLYSLFISGRSAVALGSVTLGELSTTRRLQ